MSALDTIDIYVPGSAVTYTVGVDNVTQINVHFYFANVVFVKVYLSDGTHLEFYQVPCKTYYTA